MGYYVRITDQSLSFKDAAAATAAFVALKMEFCTDAYIQAHARGGSWSGGQQVSWHYSWVDTTRLQQASSVWEIMALFFDDAVTQHQDGASFALEYDNKLGQEELLFRNLAPFIAPGSYVRWEGEDGLRWRWEFDGTTMVEDDDG